MSGCAALENFASRISGSEAFGEETREEWCRALLENTPSASAEDTTQTQEEVADIGEVIWILCRGQLPE